MSQFLSMKIPERVQYIIDNRYYDGIYEVLSKHSGRSIDELKKVYSVEVDRCRKYVNISGSMESIYNLFAYLTRFDIKFESISSCNLRIDLSVFLNAIK